MLAILGLLAAQAAPGTPGTSVPLYAVDAACDDARFPTLAGPWVVGCRHGAVARALSLETGAVVDLPRPLDAPGVGPATLYQPDRSGGFVRLQADQAILDDQATVVHQRAVAPATTDGTHVAVLSAEHVQAFEVHERARKLRDAHPAGWYPPALAWPWVAWVDDDGSIRALDTGSRDPARTLSSRGSHVVSDGRRLVWVEPGAVAWFEPASGRRGRVEARTGFNAPPAVDPGHICWEERNTRDVDIRCDDGTLVGGPGHQTWPAVWGGWLIYRQDDRVMLYTFPDRPDARR